MRGRCSRRWARSRPSGSRAAACARAGSSRRSTSTSAQLCAGMQIHVDDPGYDHAAFRPWRLVALAFKALRTLRPDYPLWRDFAYEYEPGRLAIDVHQRRRELCASGSTTRPRRRPTSTRSPQPTKRRGRRSGEGDRDLPRVEHRPPARPVDDRHRPRQGPPPCTSPTRPSRRRSATSCAPTSRS